MVSEELNQLEECFEMIQDKETENSEKPVDEPRAGDTAAAGADMGE